MWQGDNGVIDTENTYYTTGKYNSSPEDETK